MATFSYLHALKMYKEYIVVGDLYFNQVGSCCHKSERCLTISIKTFQKNLYLGTQDLFKKEELWKKYKIRFLPEMSKI